MSTRTRMRQEIDEQPAAVADTLAALAAPARLLAAAVRALNVDRIVLIARGSSDHAPRRLPGATHSRAAAASSPPFAAPSLYPTYAAPVDLRGARDRRPHAIGGDARGSIPALAYAAGRGALTACITNAGDASLARAVEHPLVTRAGVEQSVVATKTFGPAHWRLHPALSSPETGARSFRNDLAVVLPDPMSETIAVARHRGKRGSDAGLDAAAVCVGRGFQLRGRARGRAQAVKEGTSAIWAEGFSSMWILLCPESGNREAVTAAPPALIFYT